MSNRSKTAMAAITSTILLSTILLTFSSCTCNELPMATEDFKCEQHCPPGTRAYTVKESESGEAHCYCGQTADAGRENPE